MSRLVKQWIPTIIAIVTGLVVLAGYLFPDSAWADSRNSLIEWAVILAAFAFFFGMFNLLRVHGGKMTRLRQGGIYSLVLLLAMLAGMTPPILSLLEKVQGRRIPIQETLDLVIFDTIISPLGASLAALVAFTLALAAFRLMRERRSVSSLIFTLVVAVMLLGSTPFVGLEWLADVRDWIINVPGMAGMRGLLLGVALGTIITALRILMGSDRPHSEF
jgi:uncharacterized membrane protein